MRENVSFSFGVSRQACEGLPNPRRGLPAFSFFHESPSFVSCKKFTCSTISRKTVAVSRFFRLTMAVLYTFFQSVRNFLKKFFYLVNSLKLQKTIIFFMFMGGILNFPDPFASSFFLMPAISRTSQNSPTDHPHFPYS